MVVAIHRTTLELRPSADTATVPEPTWKHNPSLTAVGWTSESVPPTVPFKYWKAPADWDAGGAGPVEMSAGEKAAVDAALLAADRDGRIARYDNLEDDLRQLLRALVDEFNAHSDRLDEHGARYNALRAQILTATSLANLQTRVSNSTQDMSTDMPTRTLANVKTVIRNGYGS